MEGGCRVYVVGRCRGYVVGGCIYQNYFVSVKQEFCSVVKDVQGIFPFDGNLDVFCIYQNYFVSVNRNFVLLSKMFKEFSHVMGTLFLISKLFAVKVNILPSQKLSFCNRNLVPVTRMLILF